MGSDEVESLHDLNYWEDIEEYFTEFWKNVLTNIS
jgi:hypothetical protein